MWFSGSGNYLSNTLTLAPLTLPTGAQLDFKTQTDIEPYYDYGAVQVSANNGTWITVPGNISTWMDGRIDGHTAGWVSAHFDLSNYAGQSVRIRFLYATDWAATFPGWWVDEVRVAGSSGPPVFTDGAETLLPDWTASGWTRSH